MLCHFYTIASLLMCVFSHHIVSPLTIISTNNTTTGAYDVSHAPNHTSIVITTTTESPINDKLGDSGADSHNETVAASDLSASPSEVLSWLRPTSDYVSVKPTNEANSESTAESVRNSTLKRLLNVFKKSERREDTDLGLPPDIAHEYIDAVNPPKFRLPVPYGLGVHNPTPLYITSPSMAPLPPYENHFHAGSSVVKTKANYSSPQKQKESIGERMRNTELAALLKAELDAKKAELDLSKAHTPVPNLFAILPNSVKTDNPFVDTNYKTPNREHHHQNPSTPRPYVTSANSVHHSHTTSPNMDHNVAHNMGQQFVYGEGMPSIRVNVPSDKHTFAITTPTTISLVSTPSNVIVFKSSTTARPIQYTKMKIRTQSTSSTTKSTTTPIPSSSTTTSTTTTTTTTTPKPSTKRPPKTTPTVAANPIVNSKHNKSKDWSSRVYYDTTDRSHESTNDLHTGRRPEAETNEPYVHENIILRKTKNRKTISEDYTTESTGSNNNNNNKTDEAYNELDYADTNALNPNYTTPDGFADYPGANYRLTTERLAYILIGSCCALSILCLIVVAMSVRCRDMCDEYRSWKKAEKAALRWQRHQYRLAHHQQDLSRYFRTPVETAAQESNARPPAAPNTSSGAAPAPMFGPTCCHCISCSSSWLFRDANKAGRDWCCQRGYYHPAPRGKLPFGAASSVNTFMPRFANNSNSNNCCDDHEGDTDSLNTSDLMDSHHNNSRHNNHFQECPVPNNPRQAAQTSRQQLRRIAQPNGNHNWIHSSELVEEMHKKHTNNINNMSRGDPINGNNFRARNRQIGNENIVVWNNSNDERLI